MLKVENYVENLSDPAALILRQVRTFLMMSSTVSRRRVSVSSFFCISLMEYTTVEWSRPPNSLPMSYMLMPVISRTTYMLTLRALETLERRDGPRSMSAVVL